MTEEPVQDRHFRTDHLLADLKGRSVRAGAITVTAQALKFVLQVASIAVMARLLVPEDFGLIAMVSAMIGFVELLKDLGLSTATIQRREITHEQVNGLFWINVALGLLVMVVVAALSPAIAWFYGRSELVLVTVGFAAIAPISSFCAQHSALLKRQMKFKSLAIVDLVALILGIAAAITAAWLGARYWALVIMQAVMATAALTGVWVASDWRPSRPKIDKGVRPLLRFGIRLSGANFLRYVSQNLDSVLLGYFFGPAALGIYNRAQRLVRMPMRQMMFPVMSVATPALSRLASDGPRFNRAVCQLLRNIALFTTLFVTLLIPISDWVVRILLGPGWEESARIFAVLALFGLIQPVDSLLSTTLITWGKPGSLLKWRIFSVPLTIAGMLAGLPWGPIGIAVGVTASSVVLRLPVFLWYVGKKTPLVFFDALKSIGPLIIVGAGVSSALFLLRLTVTFSSMYVGLLACTVVGVVLYFSLLMVLPFGRETVASLLRLVPRGHRFWAQRRLRSP